MKTVFTKYSNERNPLFSIKTTIVKTDDGKFQVRKYPMTENACSHIEKMLVNSEKINKTYADGGFCAAPVKSVDGGIAFEYIEGVALDEELELAYKNDDMQSVMQIINDFKERLTGLKEAKPFIRTKEFDNIFGSVYLPDGFLATDFTCLDLAFGNLIVNDKGINIIDYEWCFDFPIPIEYLVYRALNLYLIINGKNKLIEKDIYSFLGFDKRVRDSFDKMEKNFQKYVRGNCLNLRDLYEKFSIKNHYVYDIVKNDDEKENECWSQVYLDYGDGFSENNSYRRLYKYGEKIDMDIALTDNVKACRFDPEDNSCIMVVERINACSDEGIYIPEYKTNGCKSHGTIYFVNSDPQIIFEQIKPGTSSIQISFSVFKMDSKHIESIARAVFDSYEKQCMIDSLESEIKSIKNENENKQSLIEHLYSEADNLKRDFENYRNISETNINNLESLVTQQQKYIASIENSRAWKLVLKLRKILGK